MKIFGRKVKKDTKKRKPITAGKGDYRYIGFKDTEREANKTADNLRKNGALVRVKPIMVGTKKPLRKWGYGISRHREDK